MPRKRFAQPDKESGGSWEIIYTGFILILLCFFIMLSSFATMEKSKIAQFVRSFVDAVSVLPSGTGFEQNKEVVAPSTDIVAINDELARIFKELEAFRESNDLNSQLEIALTDRGLEMRLADNSLFDIGSAAITPDARPLLDKIGSILVRGQLSVRIEGHTDGAPVLSGTSNHQLAAAQAMAVFDQFTRRNRLPSHHLFVSAQGTNRPLASNATQAGRAQNRRVELVVHPEVVGAR